MAFQTGSIYRVSFLPLSTSSFSSLTVENTQKNKKKTDGIKRQNLEDNDAA